MAALFSVAEDQILVREVRASKHGLGTCKEFVRAQAVGSQVVAEARNARSGNSAPSVAAVRRATEHGL